MKMDLSSISLVVVPLIPIFQVVCIAIIPKDNMTGIGRCVAWLCWLPLIGALIAEVMLLTIGRIEVGLFLFDRLSGALMVLISLISLIIHRFSVNYMQAERDYKGYFIVLGLLTTVLLSFVSSTNIWLLALSWTGMSFLMLRLLRYPEDSASQSTAKFVMKTFLIADVAFWAGTVLFFWLFKTSSLLHVTYQPGTFVIGLLWLIAGMGKSCNIPFSNWLPVTMTAPTPVSAMMHAGFVNAGGILFARFSLLYCQNQQLLTLMFLIGSFTMVYGSLKMLVQTDIKRSLAYSTISQMGFMILQCGLGAFSVAMFHLIAHSLFKSSLFLGSGSVINDSKGIYLSEPDAAGQPTPIWHLSLFILPVLMTIAFSKFMGIQGAASLLWIYSILPLLPLVQNRVNQPFGMIITLSLALLIQLFYASSKIISHFIFAPDLHDPILRFTSWHWVTILVSIFLLCYGAMGTKRPTAFGKGLYMRLLNQNIIFNHR